ncbi:hypothetical protein [Yoonia vestfoldensis]|uniref:hypothetical protein n=1 Tax=Yoonia vestfoldensis TaxID=245188 RepID=UPI0003618D41|nr:hypothetical protein [Yoonia vestfoldensis]
MELLYGMDPLCGWCYGIGPAIRRVVADQPGLTVRPVLAGPVTGPRVGPYAEMEGYIREASQRLQAVTGRAPSEAFFDMIRRPGVQGDSAPPSVAISAVRQAHPDQVLDFALRVTDAHFSIGADLNDPASYHAILGEMGLALDLPDLQDIRVAQAEWQAGRALGLASFPSLWLVQDGVPVPLAVDYDPARLSDAVAHRL